MNRENHPHRELLEQYLLGLTTREQADYVEELLANDPTAREELERLEGQLEQYISQQGMQEGEAANPRRALADFHDLDHEMITQMTRRNHHLTIWRLALSAVCLLLLFVAGYLFRENQNYRLAINTEKALHAQDEANHEREIAELLRGQGVEWDSLTTESLTSTRGNVLLHRVAGQQISFLDVSHLESLLTNEAYHVYVVERGDDGAPSPRRVMLSDSTRLDLLPLTATTESLDVWRGGTDREVPRDTAELEFITRIAVTKPSRTAASKL